MVRLQSRLAACSSSRISWPGLARWKTGRQARDGTQSARRTWQRGFDSSFSFSRLASRRLCALEGTSSRLDGSTPFARRAPGSRRKIVSIDFEGPSASREESPCATSKSLDPAVTARPRTFEGAPLRPELRLPSLRTLVASKRSFGFVRSEPGRRDPFLRLRVDQGLGNASYVGAREWSASAGPSTCWSIQGRALRPSPPSSRAGDASA